MDSEVRNVILASSPNWCHHIAGINCQLLFFIFLCPFGHNTSSANNSNFVWFFCPVPYPTPPPKEKKLKSTQTLFRYVFIMPRFCFSKRCQGLTSLHGACMCIELYHSHFVKSRLLLCSKQEGANSNEMGRKKKKTPNSFSSYCLSMAWRSRWCNHICELLPVNL